MIYIKMNEDDVRKIIRDELARHIRIDKYVFDKGIYILDGRHINTGETSGTKISTATTQKLGFFGVTPVDQPAAVTQPAGGAVVDQPARNGVDDIRDRLKELGLIA